MTKRYGSLFVILIVGCMLSSCDLLEVTDPTQISEADVSNSASAELMRLQALHQLGNSIGQPALYSGLLADEFLANPNPALGGGMSAVERADRRITRELELNLATVYGNLATTRWRAGNAIDYLRRYSLDPARDVHIGHMQAVRGAAELILAENFCPGLPLNEAVEGRVVSGSPLSTAQIFEHALANFDSALAGTSDSVRLANFARVGRARALLGLGRFAEAATAVAAVPVDYEYGILINGGHTLYQWPTFVPSWGVADRAGGNGLDFVSANDPRAAVVPRGKGYDGELDMFVIGKYDANRFTPHPLATGLEARLIEAEAALHAGGTAWLDILNELRASRIAPAMSPLEDPGDPEGRVDLLFRERAFWMFATGRRLGDLRRLVALYGRSPASVFPSGAYHLGGTYDEGTSLPFTADAEARHNADITGCTTY